MIRRYFARRKMRWAVRRLARMTPADRREWWLVASAARPYLVSATPAIINNWREMRDPWEPDD